MFVLVTIMLVAASVQRLEVRANFTSLKAMGTWINQPTVFKYQVRWRFCPNPVSEENCKPATKHSPVKKTSSLTSLIGHLTSAPAHCVIWKTMET